MTGPFLMSEESGSQLLTTDAFSGYNIQKLLEYSGTPPYGQHVKTVTSKPHNFL